jgi:WD40 repeat protein
VLAVLRPPGAPAESACQVVEIDQETTSHPLATYSSQVNIFRLPDGWAALDLATGQLTRHDLLSKDSPVGPPVAVSQAIVPISPTVDGDRAFGIAPDQSALILLDLRSGAVVRSTPLGNLTLREVLIAPGSRLIAWQDELGRVHSWATETGARREFPVERLDRGDVSIFMALSPDGRRLAVSTWGIPGSQTPIKVHDTQTGAELATFPGSPTRLGELAFSDDSAFLFIGSGNSLKRWDLDPPPLVTFAGHLDEAWAASFTPDGRILLTGADDTDEPQTIKAWEFATGRLLGASHPHPALVNCISLSPDGRRAVTSGLVEHHNLSLWDVRDPADPSGWRLIRELEGHGRPVRAALYRPDGKMIATAGDDLKIRLWDGVSGDLLHTLSGHTDKILQLAFSPDSKLLASVSNDKSVRIWDLNLMHAIWIPDGADPFTALAFSPDGKILAAADQTGRIVLIDPLSGGEIHRIHSDLKEIRALAYSPDGRLLASGGVDQIIRIWDTLTQREIFALGDPDGKKGPFGQINGLTFSPDGLSLISTHHSGAVILWDGHPPEDR